MDESPLTPERPDPASPNGAGLATGPVRPLSLDPDEPPTPPPLPAETTPVSVNVPPPSRKTDGRVPPSPIRLLFTVGAGFVSAFLFLRVFLVEPFGVPTGSMAPALIGNHRECPCTRCGYPVRVGAPSAGERAGYFADIPCPNCGKRTDLSAVHEVHGDRLLVDKNVFSLRSPRRWEVAVFRCPADLSKPYVKRIIGLPGEVIVIHDGDVCTLDEHNPPTRNLLRKTLVEVRETRLPVFDLSYAPPEGWGLRWIVYPPDLDPRLPTREGRPPVTADSSVVHDGILVLDAAASPQAEVRLEYRHWNLDESREEAVHTGNSYDGAPRRTPPPAHDFYLRCVVEAQTTEPVGRFACRLFDGADAVTADLPVGNPSSGEIHLTEDSRGGLAAARGVGLEPGRSHVMEFAFVDRRVTLAVDGRVVIAPVDLPPVRHRSEVKRPLQFKARGCRVVVRDLKLYRDIHYTQAGTHGTRTPARLGPDEYFMLGDNSGNSQDSREWPAPGVPEADFIGKPFLIHQPLRLGRVAVGGRERLFQTLDWSRLRWLH